MVYICSVYMGYMSEQSREQSKGRTDSRNISLMKFKGTDEQLYVRIQEEISIVIKIKRMNFGVRQAYYQILVYWLCKGRGIRDQIANIRWIIEKARDFQKNIYFCFIDYAKAFDCVDHNKLWKTLKELGIPDHLTCLLRNLFSGQEETVRTGHGITDWFQIGKGVRQDCILSPCLFNFYAEYIMRNTGLDEAQAGIKIARRNINNLRYADDTTLMAESEDELKNLLMKVKEESEKVGLRLNVQKTKIMASGPVRGSTLIETAHPGQAPY